MAQLESEGRDAYSVQSFHLKSRTMWDIASNPAILDRVQDILGPNFVMWGSHMFCKMPNDGRTMRPVPLHQDATYWPFQTTRTCTVWLALDDADEENSAMLFVPGSHRVVIPWNHFDEPGAVLANETPEPLSHALPGEGLHTNAMPAGYVSMHADLLIHGSAPNLSARRRCGLTLRYCASDTRPLGGDANTGRGTFFGGYILKCRCVPSQRSFAT
jgi:ectoine hydroxylase-related dioxygenase (phytanoyl-CoA dioxygenase family)